MLEALLAAHAAPTLACLKCASLVTARLTDPAAFGRQASALRVRLLGRGVSLTLLRVQDGSAQVFVYREKLLAEILRQPEVQAFLRELGYERFDVRGALQTLRGRMRDLTDFPHEIGVFLGYPLADVRAFIAHGGHDCAACGCWKAYGNVCEANRIFACWQACQEKFLREYRQGRTLEQLTVAA